MLRHEKEKKVEELAKMLDESLIIGVLDMHKLPARQLQQIKNKLGSSASIRMAKKTLLKRAIEKSKKKDIKKLEEKFVNEPALIFSNENPFRLFKIIKESRSPASAKAGDVAQKEILIQKGSTGLPPGPAISTLQKIGLKASVQQGKIAVMADKVIVKSGEVISEDVANVLGMLKIEPMEIGLELVAAWDGGVIYSKSVLDVDADYYLNELHSCVMKAVNLSVNAGYPTKLTVPIMIQKAFSEARSICIEASIFEKDFIDEVLAKAAREAKALEEKTNVK
jgi:large subunit ribosomal protein L10